MIWPPTMKDISPLASEKVLFFQLYFSGNEPRLMWKNKTRFISRQYASADSNHTVENVRSSYVGFDFTQIIPLAMKQILSSQDRFDRNSDFCYLIVALFLTNFGLIHMRYE